MRKETEMLLILFVGCTLLRTLNPGERAFSLKNTKWKFGKLLFEAIQTLQPGESQGRRSLVGCICGVSQSQTRLNDLAADSLEVMILKKSEVAPGWGLTRQQHQELEPLEI